jgi:hypothetical protein
MGGVYFCLAHVNWSTATSGAELVSPATRGWFFVTALDS